MELPIRSAWLSAMAPYIISTNTKRAQFGNLRPHKQIKIQEKGPERVPREIKTIKKEDTANLVSWPTTRHPGQAGRIPSGWWFGTRQCLGGATIVCWSLSCVASLSSFEQRVSKILQTWKLCRRKRWRYCRCNFLRTILLSNLSMRDFPSFRGLLRYQESRSFHIWWGFCSRPRDRV